LNFGFVFAATIDAARVAKMFFVGIGPTKFARQPHRFPAGEVPLLTEGFHE